MRFVLQVHDWRDVCPPDPMHPLLPHNPNLSDLFPDLSDPGALFPAPVVCLASPWLSVDRYKVLQKEDERLVPPVVWAPTLFSRSVPKILSSAFGDDHP
ncbi:hypothetical protein BaRGS_00021923 [Batillaria attramentaria]|uniref:Uncharacterized protein n=1 Tax=Batillaria attramentaria TaxID=370345 RepID=A0ABD0KHV8_9CAEN